MTVHELLGELQSAGGIASLDNDRVRIRAPQGRVSKVLWEQLRAHNEEIRELLMQMQKREKSRVALVPQERSQKLRLSYAQQRLWFIDKLETGTSTEYNSSDALRLNGDLNRAALERAINTIVKRHESLRTHFAEVDGEPVQIIVAESRIELPLEDLSGLPDEEKEERIQEALRQEMQEPFDLSRGPILRVKLLKIAEHDHILIKTMHHIVSDGWSQGVLNRELMILYEAYLEKRENPLPPLKIQYADFALWQRERMEKGAFDEGLKYWKEQLAGIPEYLELPSDRSRSSVQTYEAEPCEAVLPDELSQRLRKLSYENQATLYMTLLAAFSVLLQRYSGQEDIVVGSPIANRQDEQLEGLIGFFVNTLAMRVKVDGKNTFKELLAQIRRTALAAYRHQDVPFERIVEELNVVRELSRTPVFQVMFVLQNVPWTRQTLKGLEVDGVHRCELRVRFDLEVHAWEDGNQIGIWWLYKRHSFSRWRMEQMVRHFVRIMEEMTRDEAQEIRQVELLSEEERQQVLEGWNTKAEAVSAATIGEMFEMQVERTPQADAVVYGDRLFTYAELNRLSNQLAHYLIRQGAGPEDVVALVLPRSPEMVVTLLGIIKSGAAYLPLSPEYPLERLQFMLEDVNPSCTLINEDMASKLPDRERRISLDSARTHQELAQSPTHNPQDKDRIRPASPQNPAYIIYTSGSTGKPKGVVIEHRALSGFLHGIAQRLSFGPQDCQVAVTTPTFDISILELLVPLCHGSKVVIAADEETRDPIRLLSLLQRYRATSLQATPSQWGMLVQQEPGSLPNLRILVGGEPLPARLGHSLWERGSEAFNLYGPTEATIWASTHRLTEQDCDEDASEIVTIGRPLANYQFYILDQNLQPVPAGVSGELYIAGRALARGYLKRPGLTAERFVANPHGAGGTWMYRTGDMARWRSDGNVEFLGRVDQQVKVRGFRIELGEIESVLQEHERVQDAIAIVREDQPGEKRIVAYVIPRQSEAMRLEMQRMQIENWQELYDSTYRQGESLMGNFNIVGWQSSYTGEPITAEEMRIWVEETTERVRRLNARRILEIGCGTGLLLTRLAGDCERYLGVDFSPAVVEQLRNYLRSSQELQNVELREGMAHELSFLDDESVDLVILNSVVQYFPDVDYLLQVLRAAVRVTRKGGNIFVGDVRSLPLLEAYHTSVQMYKAAGKTTTRELQKRVREAQEKEEELVLDPALFHELVRRWKKVARAEISLKSGTYDNEMSRFRYDVVIGIGDEKQEINGFDRWLEWTEGGRCLEELEQILRQEPTRTIGLRSMRDGRVASAIEAVRLLNARGEELKDVNQLKAACHAVGGEAPDAVMRLARRLQVEVCWMGFNKTGVYDALFNAQWRESEKLDDVSDGYYRRYANSPAQIEQDRELGHILREYVTGKMPEYMVPDAVIALPGWPLTPNGKLDRKALPALEFISKTKYRPPQTPEEEILSGLFGEVLGIKQVGLDDNFFDLGGHSLLATRLVSRIRATMRRELPIRALFESPTVSLLAVRLHTGGKPRPPLEPQDRLHRVGLSYAQQRLWFLDRLAGGTPEYNMHEALRLRGEFDREALQKTVNAIVERHEILRTHFEERDGEPVQVVEPKLQIPIEPEDLSGLEEESQQERIQAILKQESGQVFDLARGPVLRMKVLKLREREHILLRTIHHIASDLWSHGVFNREFMVLYEAFREGRENPLKPLRVQYADFAIWQRKWLENGELQEGLEYWKEQLREIPEELNLPRDRARHSNQSHAGEACYLTIGEEQARALKRLGQAHQATLYMTLLTAFGILLCRYSGQDDIVVGSPIANRQEKQLEQMIGFFVNTLALRMKIKGEKRLKELLEQVRMTALEAYRYQDVPFERVVEELNVERNLDRTPVFQVAFALQNAPMEAYRLKGLDITAVEGSGQRVRFDLEVHAYEREERIELYWLYNRDLFDRWRVEQMAGHYQWMLAAMVENDAEVVDRLSLLTQRERHQLLYDWNDTAVEYPREQCFHELFEEQVEKSGNAVAVVFEDESLTYAELNRRANRLAHYLRKLGVGPDVRVGICVERGFEMVIGLLAILKAGGAYVPLDPSYPEERLHYMLRDSRPAVLLTQGHLKKHFDRTPESFPLLDMADAVPLWNYELETNLDRVMLGLSPAHPAYVIYTSGSTGSPKGAVLEHRGLRNVLVYACEEFSLNSQDAWVSIASNAFDISLLEMATAWLAGARTVILSRAEIQDLDFLVDRLKGITIIQAVPSLMSQIITVIKNGREEKYPAELRTLLTGGERIPPDLLREMSKLFPGRRIVALYGPTEATLFCADQNMGIDIGTACPIGSPIANTLMYILDGQGEPVPVGVEGEIHIGGTGVARGYWERPELTAARFVPDPYTVEAGKRMYRTGDLGRWLADGNIEFLGRNDDQAKLRGYRIELSEIEAVLREYPAISQAVVVMREVRGEEKQLVAYVVAAGGDRLDLGSIRRRLEQRLPEYMVPTVIVQIEQVPLTPNKKIDRQALPAPDSGRPASKDSRNMHELLLVGLFAEILGMEQVGIDDNFFELGGHSLLAARLISRTRAVMGVELGVRVLFESPTPAGLAARLAANNTRGNLLSGILPLRTSGAHAPLFCIHPGGGLGTCYVGLTRVLGPDHPVYALQARGLENNEPFADSIQEMAHDYLVQIRRVQPRGPYHLLGWSLGGLIAHAVASALQEQGEAVALLTVLDTAPLDLTQQAKAYSEAEFVAAIAPDLGLEIDFEKEGIKKPETAAEMFMLVRQFAREVTSSEEAVVSRQIELLQRSLELMRLYTLSAAPFTGHLLCFAAAGRTTLEQRWRPYVHGEITIRHVPVEHIEMMKPAALSHIGPVLKDRISKMT